MKKNIFTPRESNVDNMVVQIYLMRTDEAEKHYDKYMECITTKRRDYILGLKNRENQLASLAAGYLLYRYLDVKTDDDLEIGPYGKLYLKLQESFFNISHADKYVVLAIAEKEIGVDIEPIHVSEYIKSLPSKAFTAEEKEWLLSHTEEEAFSLLWTKKEAVLKAEGQGFQRDPQDISVLSTQEFYIESEIVNDYAISCAMKIPFTMKVIYV